MAPPGGTRTRLCPALFSGNFLALYVAQLGLGVWPRRVLPVRGCVLPSFQNCQFVSAQLGLGVWPRRAVARTRLCPALRKLSGFKFAQ